MNLQQQNLADFIWSVADMLRGDFRQSDFGRIILLFTVLRRLECVLEPTRDKVRSQFLAMHASGVDMDVILPTTAGATFYNVSQFALDSVGSTSTRANLEDYIAKFSFNAHQVFQHFNFADCLSRLETANLLYSGDAEVRQHRLASQRHQQPRNGPGVRAPDPQTR